MIVRHKLSRSLSNQRLELQIHQLFQGVILSSCGDQIAQLKGMRCLMLLLLFLLGFGFPQRNWDVASAQGPSSGYISDVAAEKAEKFNEVYLFIPAKKETSLQELIFSPLSKEFKEKYLLPRKPVVITDATAKWKAPPTRQ